MSKLVIEAAENVDQPTHFIIRPVFEGTLQKCPCRTIDYIAEKPRMRYWTVTESNITVRFCFANFCFIGLAFK